MWSKPLFSFDLQTTNDGRQTDIILKSHFLCWREYFRETPDIDFVTHHITSSVYLCRKVKTNYVLKNNLETTKYQLSTKKYKFKFSFVSYTLLVDEFNFKTVAATCLNSVGCFAVSSYLAYYGDPSTSVQTCQLHCRRFRSGDHTDTHSAVTEPLSSFA